MKLEPKQLELFDVELPIFNNAAGPDLPLIAYLIKKIFNIYLINDLELSLSECFRFRYKRPHSKENLSLTYKEFKDKLKEKVGLKKSGGIIGNLNSWLAGDINDLFNNLLTDLNEGFHEFDAEGIDYIIENFNITENGDFKITFSNNTNGLKFTGNGCSSKQGNLVGITIIIDDDSLLENIKLKELTITIADFNDTINKRGSGNSDRSQLKVNKFICRFSWNKYFNEFRTEYNTTDLFP